MDLVFDCNEVEVKRAYYSGDGIKVSLTKVDEGDIESQTEEMFESLDKSLLEKKLDVGDFCEQRMTEVIDYLRKEGYEITGP